MAHRRELSVVAIGDVNSDWVVSVADMHEAIENLRLHGADTILERVGGSGVILANAFRRAGVATTLICSVGRDEPGARAIAALRRRGVRVIAHRTGKIATGKVIIVQSLRPESLERKGMVSHRGANVELRLTQGAVRAVRQADLLVVSGYALLQAPQSTSVVRVVREAGRCGVPVFIDVVPHEVFRQVVPKDYRECLEMADGVCLELGTARALLRARHASVAEVVDRLAARFAVVIMRRSNDRQICVVNGRVTEDETGYSAASERTGYLDAVLARQLVKLFRGGKGSAPRRKRARAGRARL